MKKNQNNLILLSLLAFVIGCSDHEVSQASETAVLNIPRNYSVFTGETIQYSVKKLIKVGEANLTFKGLSDYQGKQYYLILFNVNAPTIVDQEKIYADVQTLYPAFVERDVKYLGNHEKITEAYDQTQGEVKVTKIVDGKTEEIVLKKEGAIDNIYCFIYRQRLDGAFKEGESFSAKLPTLDLKIQTMKQTTVNAGGKKYDAFYMQSVPAKYRLWFDTSSSRIPLRINGAVGLSDAAMIMTKYSKE